MKLPKSFTKITPFSKYLALTMLIVIPILAFFYGQYYERVTKTTQPTTAVTPTTAEGTFCGGIAGIQCSDGYRCKFSCLDGSTCDDSQYPYPDAGGVCIKN